MDCFDGKSSIRKIKCNGITDCFRYKCKQGHNFYNDLDEEKGKETVRTAVRNGITLLDTAYIYGPERSEELVGEAVKEFARDEFAIATKGAHYFDEDGNVKMSNDPEFLKDQVEKA